MNFTPEMLNIAKNAKTAEDLIALAKENNVEATEEEIKAYFEQTHTTGELADDELDNVAGGGCGGGGGDEPAYDSPQGYFRDGDTVVSYSRHCLSFPNSGCCGGNPQGCSFKGVIHFTSRTEWYVICSICGKEVVHGNEHPLDVYSLVRLV